MFIGDLTLPDGRIMEYLTGDVIERDFLPTDIAWIALAGHGVYSTAQRTSQPAVGCVTGGDKVFGHLMMKLAEK